MATLAPQPNTAALDAGEQASDLLLADLLNDFGRLGELLVTELASAAAQPSRSAGHLVDAYLLGAALNQLTEDHLHRQPHLLTLLGERGRGRGRAVAALAGALPAARWRAVEASRSTASLVRWQRRLEQFMLQLAHAVSGGTRDLAQLSSEGRALIDAPFPTALSTSILRLPDSHRGFDQQPEDCGLIAARFAERWPDRARPLEVIGVRTSGSYLAPLCGAYLERLGFGSVGIMTLRPGQHWLPHERQRIAGLARSGGLALLIDDPPASGSKLASTAAEVIGVGLPPSSVILLIQLFGTAEAIPDPLRPYQSVLLPWAEWTIHQKLDQESVRQTLDQMLRGREVATPRGPFRVSRVTCVERLDPPSVSDVKARSILRSHLRALFRATLADHLGTQRELMVHVKGTGLGYLGRHSLKVTDALDGWVPQTFGWQEGLLYRAWLPEPDRASSPADFDQGRAQAISSYVLARAKALPASQDSSARLVRRKAAWQQASDLLRPAFGNLDLLLRPLLHAAARQLVRVERPSVVDGSTALSQFFAGGPHGLLKVDYDERTFSVWDTYCYDSLLDLAIAAADARARELTAGVPPRFAGLLRHAHLDSGAGVSPERWLLYQLMHLERHQPHYLKLLKMGPGQLQTASGAPADLPQTHHEGEGFVDQVLAARYGGERSRSVAVSEYLAEAFMADCEPGRGPVLAVPLEGWLERPGVLFGGITPSGALALRALLRHGFRPLLVSGLDLVEVDWRVGVLHLAGGIAGWGAALRAGGGEALVLRSDAVLVALKAELEELPQVHIEHLGRQALRACTLTDGMRRALDPGQVSRLGTVRRGEVIARRTETHTDFSPSADLQVALDQAALELGADGVTWLSQPGSQGACPRALAAAVQRRIGHPPGACPICRVPVFSPSAQLLLEALKAHDLGRGGKLFQALRLARLVATAGRARLR